MAVPSMPLKRWNFHKAKWSHYIALMNKFAKTLLPPDSLDVDAAYQDFWNTIKKTAKKTIPRGYRNNYIPCSDAECESLYKPFCSLLRETTQVWLLQLCLPHLTESAGIDGPRQFGALTSHTLVEKRGVFRTTLLVSHDTLLVTVPFQPMLLHLIWLEMGNTRLWPQVISTCLPRSVWPLEGHNTRSSKYLWQFFTERICCCPSTL